MDVTHHGTPQTATAAPTTELNNTQLVLAFESFLRYLAQCDGGKVDKAFLARFMHMVSGKPYSKLQNSGLYRQLQRLSELLKKNKRNIKELHQHFADFGLSELSKMLTNSD